ncbi:MAG: HAMP domain-containing protein [candidate division NC10 bacterium]|nr:HAMP domain-containing protein [candidate division NC10 bacterium]
MSAPPLRPWHRLSVRLAALLVAVTLLGIGLVATLLYQQQKREMEKTLGTFLLNIARTGALLIDPALHVEVEATLTPSTPAYRRLRAVLAAIQDENRLETPIYTLTDFAPGAREARFMVTSRGPGAPGEIYRLAPALLEPLGQAFREGVATQTLSYHDEHGTWITAFAPLRDAGGRIIAVLDVDYRVDVYLERLAWMRRRVLETLLLGGMVAVVAGVLLSRRISGPVSALTRAVARVAEGDLSQPLPVRSRDEVGMLTRAFNAMLDGLRQRDFIRDAFGRYVSPEVARALLESPEGLRLGGDKREVTILMSDLRGYTRWVEETDPTVVVRVLNAYLARMTEIIIEYEGSINEFIGDAIFAIFGAPLAAPDHAERAAACAIAMQRAMAEVNRLHLPGGLSRLEMGIGLNTGEAVVGNIGSEKRAKYGVVGSAVNLAARVQACTIGGQVLLSPHTYERIRGIAEVGPPIPIEVKGIREPLLLYELQAVAGPWGQRLPEAAADAGPEVPVALPLACWVVEGTTIRPERLRGQVLRLGLRRLEARVEHPLAPLTNLRLRLRYPALAQDSGDLYGKVLDAREEAGAWVVRIGLTSVDGADQQVLESLLRGAAAGQP